jgi:hypothetical protein
MTSTNDAIRAEKSEIDANGPSDRNERFSLAAGTSTATDLRTVAHVAPVAKFGHSGGGRKPENDDHDPR